MIPQTRTGGSALPCPRCGTPTLRTPAGEHLDMEPHPLAIHRPDGTDLDTEAAREQLRNRAPPAGHHLHRCPSRRRTRPNSNPDQLTLL